MNARVENWRKYWRLYVAFIALLVVSAEFIHLVAGISLMGAMLFAVLGVFINGLLILIGDSRRRGESEPPEVRHFFPQTP